MIGSIGAKRDRIQIITRESVLDAGGGVLPGLPVIYWDTYAEVNTIKNQRNAQAYQSDLEEPKEFRLRYRGDKNVTKNMMVIHNGIEYAIQSNIDIDMRKRELIIIGLTRK